MKRKVVLVLSVVLLCSSSIPVFATHWKNPNAYTTKEPIDIPPIVSMHGPQDTMVPTVQEYIEWYGEPPPPDWDPDPVPIPYDEINTYLLERLMWHFRYALNMREFHPATAVALFNAFTEEHYPNEYLKLNYPLDAREMAWMDEEPEEVLDWEKQEYWAMWRGYGRNPEMDLSNYFDYDEWKDRDDKDEIIDEDYHLTKIQAARLYAYMCQGLLNIPSFDPHPEPNMRSNPMIWNDVSNRQDYTYWKGSTWDYASRASKWYALDLYNYFTGEIDILYGSEDRYFVDQANLIDRHNQRSLLPENPGIQYDIDGANNMYEAFAICDKATKGAPTTAGNRYVKGYKSWIMGVIRGEKKYEIEVKFKEGMYDVVVQAIQMSGDPAKMRMITQYRNSLYWMIHYWIDDEYIKYETGDT